MPFSIAPMPDAIAPMLLQKLARCNTATIGHFESDGFLDPGFAPVMSGRRVAGTAVTIEMPFEDSVLTHYAISGARPGDFLAIARGGDLRFSAWGGTTAKAAALAGVTGVIVDGPTIDWPEQHEAGLACWGRGTSPLTCKKLGLGGAVNQPVRIGGVIINPGDAVLADDNGIYVCAPGRVEAIADEALARQARKPQTVEKLMAGTMLGELSGADQMVRAALHAEGILPPW